MPRHSNYAVRKLISELDNSLTDRIEDDEQGIVMGDGTAEALHLLLGRMSLDAYRQKGLTDEQADSLSRLYHTLF